MKKKFWKIVALVIAWALIVGIAAFANSLVGNPISRMMAKHTVEKYLAETYADTDYYVEKLGFSFKSVDYYAHIRSESSMDTQFTLYIDMWGRLFWDTYDDVLSGSITARRLEQEYRDLTDQIFDSPTFPYTCDIAFGTLEIHPREAIDNPEITDIPDYSIIAEDLILDKIYDPRELGAQAGHLIVYVDSDSLTYEAAAQILLDIRAEFDEANIPFRTIDFTLQYPRPEEGPRSDEYIGVENFPYEEIYEEDLAARIAEADAELKAYRAILDAEMEKILATAPTES